MSAIGWDEASPPSTEQISLGDSRIRSLKTSLRLGLATEHTWPTAGGDAGVHLLGSARAYYGAQSLVSSSGTDGRLHVTSDTSRLFHVGSAGTMYIGGSNVLEVGNSLTTQQTTHRVMDLGVTTAGKGTYTYLTFSPAFDSIPLIVTQPWYEGTTAYSAFGVTIYQAGPADAYLQVFNHQSGSTASLSGLTILWYALGTRAF